MSTIKSTIKSNGNPNRDKKASTTSEQDDNESDANTDESRSTNSDQSVIEQLNPYAEIEDGNGNDSSVAEVQQGKGETEHEAEGTTRLKEAARKERKKQRAAQRLEKEAKEKALKRTKKREAKEQKEKEDRYDPNTPSNKNKLINYRASLLEAVQVHRRISTDASSSDDDDGAELLSTKISNLKAIALVEDEARRQEKAKAK